MRFPVQRCPVAGRMRSPVGDSSSATGKKGVHRRKRRKSAHIFTTISPEKPKTSLYPKSLAPILARRLWPSGRGCRSTGRPFLLPGWEGEVAGSQISRSLLPLLIRSDLFPSGQTLPLPQISSKTSTRTETSGPSCGKTGGRPGFSVSPGNRRSALTRPETRSGKNWSADSRRN